MSQTVITQAFETLKAQEAANGGVVTLDEFVFASVPDLNITDPIDRTEGLPPVAQIVHRQDVSKTGMINSNAVVYSVVLGADVGDFEFNWVGLLNKASGVVAMIVHAPSQKKIKTASGQQGNVLTRSFLMEYNGASQQTQIITPADTWQIDFTARLNGVDERIRQENIDIYGAGSFLGDGYLTERNGSTYTVKKGVGYVAGLRTELVFDQVVAVPAFPAKIWLDVCWRGTMTSVWATSGKLTVADTLADYLDGDEAHFVCAIAEVLADGSLVDLRQVNITDAFSRLKPEPNTIPLFNASEELELAGVSDYFQSLLDKSDAPQLREAMGVHLPLLSSPDLQHKVIHDLDYSTRFSGADGMSQGFCVCETPDGYRMFIHHPTTAGVRIVETVFNPDGNNENPAVISFSSELADISHQSLACVYENGGVVIYTLTEDGKGINKIVWKGNATSTADIVRQDILTGGLFDTDTAYTLAISTDSRLLLIQSAGEDYNAFYNGDDKRVIYLFNRETLAFIRPVLIPKENMIGDALQGMAADSRFIYVLYGYTGVFLTQRLCVYTLGGEPVRKFNIDGVRCKYGRGGMLGGGALGYPVLQEPEGLAIVGNKLYMLAMDFWNSTADVVSFAGKYFAARAESFSGESPLSPSRWTPTTYGIAGAAEYDKTRVYTTGLPTKRAKAIVSIELDDGTGYPVDSGAAYPDSHASIFQNNNAINLALAWGEDFQLALWCQNLQSHKPLLEVRKESPGTTTNAVALRLYGDAYEDGVPSGRYAQIKHRFSSLYDTLEIRSDEDLNKGAGINANSARSATTPGRLQLYCADGVKSHSLAFSPTVPSFHAITDNSVSLGVSGNSFADVRSYKVTCIAPGSTQVQVRTANDLKNGVFQTSQSGNFGPYDDTAAKWLIASRTDGTAFMQMNTDITGDFAPSVNNTYNIGAVAKAFKNGYFNNSPTVVSDATLKDEPREATALENQAFAKIARLPSVWRWLQRIDEEGEDARLHSGPTVQAAIAIMVEHGLDWSLYSAFCYDKWNAQDAEYETVPAVVESVPDEFPIILGDDGQIITRTKEIVTRDAFEIQTKPAVEAGERYRFRKEELLWWCFRAVVSQFDDLDVRMSRLESVKG